MFDDFDFGGYSFGGSSMGSYSVLDSVGSSSFDFGPVDYGYSSFSSGSSSSSNSLFDFSPDYSLTSASLYSGDAGSSDNWGAVDYSLGGLAAVGSLGSAMTSVQQQATQAATSSGVLDAIKGILSANKTTPTTTAQKDAATAADKKLTAALGGLMSPASITTTAGQVAAKTNPNFFARYFVNPDGSTNWNNIALVAAGAFLVLRAGK